MNETNAVSKTRVVTFRDLWDIFLQRWWVLILAAAIAVAAVFGIRQIVFVPHYSSTATLYILR